MKIVPAILAAAMLFAAPAFAHEETAPPPLPAGHSGGTDAKGCHTNHKTGDYHCHKPK